MKRSDLILGFLSKQEKKEAILLKDPQLNTHLPYSLVDLLKRKVLLCFLCILIGCCQQSCLVHTFHPAAGKISCWIHPVIPAQKAIFQGARWYVPVPFTAAQPWVTWLVCTIPRESSLVKVSSCTAGSARNDCESPRDLLMCDLQWWSWLKSKVAIKKVLVMFLFTFFFFYPCQNCNTGRWGKLLPKKPPTTCNHVEMAETFWCGLTKALTFCF